MAYAFCRRLFDCYNFEFWFRLIFIRIFIPLFYGLSVCIVVVEGTHHNFTLIFFLTVYMRSLSLSLVLVKAKKKGNGNFRMFAHRFPVYKFSVGCFEFQTSSN